MTGEGPGPGPGPDPLWELGWPVAAVAIKCCDVCWWHCPLSLLLDWGAGGSRGWGDAPCSSPGAASTPALSRVGSGCGDGALADPHSGGQGPHSSRAGGSVIPPYWDTQGTLPGRGLLPAPGQAQGCTLKGRMEHKATAW